jgi:hypothetical protein
LFSQQEIETLKKLVREARKSKAQADQQVPLGSLFETLFEAIETYNRKPSLANFQSVEDYQIQILMRTEKYPGYQEVSKQLGSVLDRERATANTFELVNQLATNKFRTSSDTQEYVNAFGNSFVEKLRSLGAGDRWLDGGAGEAKAMIEYLEGGGQARCTATGYEIPKGASQSIEEASRKLHFNYISGKFFSEISTAELELDKFGRFKLITDLNGVLYYTKTLVEDLRRYLEILDINGKLFFTSITATITAENATKESANLPWFTKWASNIGGVNVTFHKNERCTEIEKTQGSITTMPDLELVKYEKVVNRNDPTREYKCVHILGNNPKVI